MRLSKVYCSAIFSSKGEITGGYSSSLYYCLYKGAGVVYSLIFFFDFSTSCSLVKGLGVCSKVMIF